MGTLFVVLAADTEIESGSEIPSKTEGIVTDAPSIIVTASAAAIAFLAKVLFLMFVFIVIVLSFICCPMFSPAEQGR